MKRQDATFKTPYEMANSIERDNRGRFRGSNEASYTKKETWERYGFIVIKEEQLNQIPDDIRSLIRIGYIAITDGFLFEMHRVVTTDIVYVSSRDYNIAPSLEGHTTRMWIFPPQYRELLLDSNKGPLEPDDGVSNRK